MDKVEKAHKFKAKNGFGSSGMETKDLKVTVTVLAIIYLVFLSFLTDKNLILQQL